jgi:hypothetical protein
MQFPFRGTAAPAANLALLFGGSGSRIRSRSRRKKEMIEYRSFTGGIFETNCYALEAPEAGSSLMLRMLRATGSSCRESRLRLLLLTHGTSITSRTYEDQTALRLPGRRPSGQRADALRSEFFRNFGFQFEIER